MHTWLLISTSSSPCFDPDIQYVWRITSLIFLFMLEESMNLPLTEPLMHWKLSDKQWNIHYIAKSIGTPLVWLL